MASKSDAPKKKAANKTKKSPEKNNLHVRVVAIGASAGGLEPIEKFFDNMPTDSGLAFVIVQHLSPDFRSMMDELIARHSNMRIRHAEDQLEIEPNTIYLNPARTDLGVRDGRLLAKIALETGSVNLPIDTFFRSVAAEYKENAIGIVFSGTGTDGTKGARSIIDNGGMTIVQDPKTAKFDSMPRSVIDRGMASVVARPEKIPNTLKQIMDGAFANRPELEDEVLADPEDQIINLLEKKYGADFGYYKYATVGRRIQRRAALNHFSSLERYAEKVASDANELETLYHDLLIGVTSFFRDHSAFEALRDDALPELMTLMSDTRQLRIWIPGCATGQEAYTIAIMLNEMAEIAGQRANVKIFATDLHLNSLDFAQDGIYDEDSIKNVPTHLLEKYFTKRGDGYHISMAIKRMVVFSQHNLLRDPPFTRIDMVSCRNVLIYFNDFVQHKVVAYFHFALNKDGFLFLGPSETVAKHTDEFGVVNKRWRLYKKIHDVKLLDATTILPLSRDRSDQGSENAQSQNTRTLKSATSRGAPPERQLLMKAYDAILAKYAPTSFLVDQNRELVHVFGDSEKYIKIGTGLFSRYLADIVHPDLRLLIAAGLDHVSGRKSAEFHRAGLVKFEDGTSINVMLTVETMPLQWVNFFLVSIQERATRTKDTETTLEAEPAGEFYFNRIRELEIDLKSTEESLQTSIEELETSNEELQSTNEELMASNEELQSTNEELHSVNEELYTVSAEHQKKIEELVEATDDLDNLLKATDIGTIFLDDGLNVRRFTPAAARAVNLIEHDLGRPFQHITYRFNYPNLFQSIQKAFDDGIAFEESVEIDSRAHLLRVQPFNHNTDYRAGIVIVIIDVHDLASAREQLARQKESYEQLVEHQSNVIVRTDLNLKISYANNAFLRLTELTSENVHTLDLAGCVEESERDNFLETVQSALKEGKSSIKIKWEPAGVEEVWIDWVIKQISDDELQLVGTDVTSVRHTRLKLVELNEKLAKEERRYRELYRQTPAMMHSINEDGVIIEASDHWKRMMGYDPGEVIGRHSTEFLTEESATFAKEEVLPEFWERGYINDVPYQMKRKDGRIIDVELSGIVQDETSEEGRRQSLAVIRDTTNHMDAERKLQRHIEELDRANNALNEFNRIISHDLKSPLRSIQHITEWIKEDMPDNADEKLKEHVAKIGSQAEQMSAMLNDLLDYASVELSTAEVETFDLKAAIRSVVDAARLGKTASVRFKNVPDEITELKAPLLLVMRNLVENSIKHNDHDKAKILVTYAQRDDMLRFTIEDDGPGIAPAHQEKIFLPFRKMHKNEGINGSGMGLALVKKVVEINGGALTVESEPDVRRGAKFSFSWKPRARLN